MKCCIYQINILFAGRFFIDYYLEGPDFNVVNLESRVVSVPGGVPSLLSVVEVGGGIGGGVQPWLRGWSVYSVIGEVPGDLTMKNVFKNIC